MPRRTKEEARETRRRILHSALDTFGEKGFTRASLANIAARIGLTKGAVYWHFENKVDLFCSLAREMDARGERTVAGTIEDLEDLDDVPSTAGCLHSLVRR